MSTIEKAAAKLAKRSRLTQAKGGEEVSDGNPALDARPANPTIIQGRYQGFVNAAEHVCEIDLSMLRQKGYLMPGDGHSQLAQEMRRIKRPLILNVQKARAKPSSGPPANLVMLTSSLPGEGKTFVAINLAISLAAELDRRVLLVDADVSKGGITQELGVQANRGLSDLLYETNFIGEDAVLTSNVARLSILPAGGHTDQIDELFASELMGTITRELADADPERVVLFDAPPMLVTTEAAVLARHMGQIVLIVEANKTPQSAVSRSVDALKDCANVSLLLNKATQHSASLYGYGYGYGYGYSGAKRRPAEANVEAEPTVQNAEQTTMVTKG